MKPNLVQAGDIWVDNGEDGGPDEVKFALLIQCESAEQVREAMASGKIEFTKFEHYETKP